MSMKTMKMRAVMSLRICWRRLKRSTLIKLLKLRILEIKLMNLKKNKIK